MPDLFDLQGRTVLVTGGLGQIGSELVRELHGRGSRVVVASRTADREGVAAALPDLAGGDRLLPVAMDVTDEDTVEAALDTVEREWGGPPDVVVNNAGLDTQPSAPPEVSGPFEDFPLAVFREVVDVNLVGTFLVTQRTGRRMRRAGRPGSIINVGSIYGMVSPVQDIYAYREERTGVPFVKPVAYTAAKSGVYNLTRYCATYWARHGIRVNTLTPSGVARDTQDETFRENYTARIPIGRMAEADEFNGAVVFLASDASRYMTGANLVVDGGVDGVVTQSRAPHRITAIDVHLVSAPVVGGFADATRKVETLGYTIVRLRTDSGLEGIGFTYHEVGGEAIKALVERDLAPRLLGVDPLQNEVVYRDLTQYLRGVGRKGLMFCALSAVDTALWDLKGKIVDLPLFRLLGGAQTEVPVYASGGWTSYEDSELVEEMLGMVAQGYTMVKFKVGVDGGRNLRRDLRRVTAVREALGPDVGLMLDANNCWDASTGVQFANRVRDLDIMWLEEPVPADDLPGLARYKRGTDVPLATGEHEYTKAGARDLIAHEAVDVLQVDGARSGGYTEMLKIAALCEAWNLRFAPHAMEYLHWHLVSAAPSGFVLERLQIFEDITSRLFVDLPLPVAGHLRIPELPGLGLELDMDFVRAHDQR